MAEPGLRGPSRLLDAAPAGTFVYIALPNVSGQLAESYQVLQERLASSPLLAQWWQEQIVAQGLEPRLDELTTRLHDFGAYLGDEVVVTLQPAADAGGHPGATHGPLILAEATRPGLRAYLEQEVARIDAEAGKQVLVLVDDPASPPAVPSHGLLLWTGDGLFAAAADPAVLAAGVASARGQAPNFAGSGLHEQVARAYADGVEWLFAGDLGELFTGAPADHRAELERLGLADLRYLVVEHRGEGEQAVTTAEVTVSDTRRGIVSWLAAPGPMGSLEFISPEASMAAAFVVKSPAEILDDVAGFAAADPNAARGLAALKSTTGVDLRDDLAAALGGEVAFALDGPLAPTPAWKLVVEVYDPARLQSALERLAAHADEQVRAAGDAAGVTLDSEPVGDAHLLPPARPRSRGRLPLRRGLPAGGARPRPARPRTVAAGGRRHPARLGRLPAPAAERRPHRLLGARLPERGAGAGTAGRWPRSAHRRRSGRAERRAGDGAARPGRRGRPLALLRLRRAGSHPLRLDRSGRPVRVRPRAVRLRGAAPPRRCARPCAPRRRRGAGPRAYPPPAGGAG